MTRAAHWRHTYLQTGLREGSLACLGCGQVVPLQLTTTPNLPSQFAALAPALPASHGLWAQCDRCQWLQQVDVEALASTFPAVQAFWRQHKRIATLPPRQVDYAGAPALVVGFQTPTGSDQIDLFFHCQTLAILATHPR